MEKKMTKKDYFAELINIVNAAGELDDTTRKAYLDFINHEVELLDRKAEKSKETKTQKENVGISASIMNALVGIGKPVTITELQDADATMKQYSNQKLSALLKKLVDAGEVVKTTDKKKSYFSVIIASGEDSVPTPEGEQDRQTPVWDVEKKIFKKSIDNN